MLRNHFFKTESLHIRLGVARSSFLLVTNRWLPAALLLPVLLITACGNNEEITGVAAPHETEPNYYPMSVGSRWVYRNPDGSVWTREATETEFIVSRKYQIFSYSPPRDYQLEYLNSPAYEATYSHLLLFTGDEARRMMEEVIYGTDAVPFLTSFKTTVDMGRSFVLLRFPLYPEKTWETLNIRLTGGSSYGHQPPWPELQRQDLSFEADWVVSARAGQLKSVSTPAGAFEDCLMIEYQPKQQSAEVTAHGRSNADLREALLRTRGKGIRENLSTLFASVMPKLGLETVWLAPGVGPVKMKTPDGIAELIDYEMK